MFLSRGNRDIGVAFQSHLVGHASSRVEAKDSTILSSHDAPSCCAFTHRVAFEEGSGPRVLLKSGPGTQGRSACGPTHVARLDPRAPGWGRQHHSQRETPFVPSKRLPDWASLVVQL